MHRAAPYDAHDPHANTYMRTWLTMHGTKQQRTDAVIKATHLPVTVATILRSIDTDVTRETLVQLLDGAQVSWKIFADYDSIILAHETKFPPTHFTPTLPTSNSPRTQAILDAYVDDLRTGRAYAPPHGPSTDDDTPDLISDSDSDADNRPDPSSSSDSDTNDPPGPPNTSNNDTNATCKTYAHKHTQTDNA